MSPNPPPAMTYTAWWYPWSTLCALVGSLGFLVAAVIGDLRHSLFTVILVVVSYLVASVIARSNRAALPVG